MIKRTLQILFLLVVFVLPSNLWAAVSCTTGDQAGTLWTPYVEWTCTGVTFSGSAFDVVSTATFTHATADSIDVEMFWSSGASPNGVFKLRFAATATGSWSFTTTSSTSDLNNYSGSATITRGSAEYGFTTNSNNKWARQIDEYGTLETFIPNFAMGVGEKMSSVWTTSFLDAQIDTFVNTHGFIGHHAFMASKWAELSDSGDWTLLGGDYDPDPNAFDLLEHLIKETHDAGGVTHIWYVGDCARDQCIESGPGQATIEEKRILRYVAARLGPMPGWIMGYGYDVTEYATASEIDDWHDYLQSKLGWTHLLGAREHINVKPPTSHRYAPYTDFVSWGGWNPAWTYSEVQDALAQYPNQPQSLDERFYADRAPYDTMAEQRRLLWRYAMAGGPSAIWGWTLTSGVSASYPNPEQIKTYSSFWDYAFAYDLDRESDITDTANAYGMADTTNQVFIIYAENTNSIDADLLTAGMTSSQPAFAIDTTATYAQVDLGTLTATDNQTINPGSTSDWVIFIGGDEQNDYYVDNNGAASWSSCYSAVPLSGTSACSLATANANVAAGDTVYLRVGTYNTNISPGASGSSGNLITYQAYNDELVTIDLDKTTCNEANTGISVPATSYIKISGSSSQHMVFTDLARLGNFKNGAQHNEVAYVTMDGAGSTCGDFEMYFRNLSGPPWSSHNWIHDSTFHDGGYTSSSPCNDIGGVIKFGDDVNGDIDSGYNTFEDNTVYNGSHHTMRVSSQYNVIRNNTYRSYGWMTNPGGCPYNPNINGKFGGRNLSLVDYNDSTTNPVALVENNKFHHAGKPPDDDGGHNLVVFSGDNIIRYNEMVGASMQGIYIRGTAPDNNAIYNNTIAVNGYEGYEYNGGDASHDGAGIGAGFGGLNNNVKNNLLYGNYGWDGGEPEYINHDFINMAGNTVENNWATDNNDSAYLCSGCYGDPQFVEGTGAALITAVNTVANKENINWWPDLSLQSGSGAINAGTHLTTVSAVTTQTNITLADASYFQDGSWGSELSNIQADWIAIGTVGNTVQIASISGNTVNLENSISCSNNDKVWLYKDSDGTQVLYGSAPNIGAYEYVEAEPTISSATIGADGEVEVNYSETVVTTNYANGPPSDHILNCTVAGDDINMTIVAGGSGSTREYTTDVEIRDGDDCTIDYNGASGHITDTDTNDLATCSDCATVTNSSHKGLSIRGFHIIGD